MTEPASELWPTRFHRLVLAELAVQLPVRIGCDSCCRSPLPREASCPADLQSDPAEPDCVRLQALCSSRLCGSIPAPSEAWPAPSINHRAAKNTELADERIWRESIDVSQRFGDRHKK